MEAAGMGIDDLKGRLTAASYVVDAAAVAEAMLRRPSGMVLLAPVFSAGARTPAAPPAVRSA